MNQVEKDVLAWIEGHQGDLIAGLQRLVSIPSIVGSEETCQQAVAELMEASCDSVDVWEPEVAWLEGHPAYFPRGVDFKGRPNVVGVVKGSGGGRSLIVNAHADVVEPGPEEAWPHGPWSGTVAGGRLYGRGSVDDKAGLAIMILLARCLRDLGLRLGGDLILESVADEEWGGGGTLATLHRGYTADAAILFEATRLHICPAARGGQAFRVTVTGKGAHPIRSYEGVSALDKAIPLLGALRRLERDRQERFRTELFEPYPIFMPITVGTISADEFPSKVPERCVFQGLMGYSPDETYQQAREELEACIAQTAATDPWLAAHPPLVEWIGLNKEGAQTPADHPLVRLLDSCYVEVTGVPATITGFTAGCDLPYLTNYGGMPSAIFGPGDPAIAHTSEEHVEIEELMRAAKILALGVLRWCG
jgi:acetylornithine deacetylase